MDYSMKTILIIEDNQKLLTLNSRVLSGEGFQVLPADTIGGGRKILHSSQVDLILLDIILPDGSGLDFCRELRKESIVPVLFLTGKQSSKDVVKGLQMGGDDYMTKPYYIDELVARIDSLLRRQEMLQQKQEYQNNIISFGPLLLDCMRFTAYFNGHDLCLTPKEFAILKILIQNDGDPVAAEDLYQLVWDCNGYSMDVRAVWTHVSKLRSKLDTQSDDIVDIRSERGQGYVLECILTQ